MPGCDSYWRLLGTRGVQASTGIILVTHRKEENTIAEVIWAVRADCRRYSSLAMLAAKHCPWLSAWLDCKMLLDHLLASFLIAFQQDKLHLETVDREAPMSAFELGWSLLATSVGKLCPCCGWSIREQKAVSPHVWVPLSIVFFSSFKC